MLIGKHSDPTMGQGDEAFGGATDPNPGGCEGLGCLIIFVVICIIYFIFWF